MSTYHAGDRYSRRQLATALTARLAACGFVLREEPGTSELVYARPVEGTNGQVQVLVYTSVVNIGGTLEVRELGTDAIRACAIYRAADGRVRGIARAEARVFRTGQVEAIVGRTYARMREVYGRAKNPERCTCGAPKFMSRNRNLVCAELCFTRR